MVYFIAGAGIWGCVMAERIASVLREPVTIFERRSRIGGNCYSEKWEDTGIECHIYGSHIFHTSLPEVNEYIRQFDELTPYRHKVLAKHGGRVFSMPINLFTINKFYGKELAPGQAEEFLGEEISRDRIESPQNFEEKGISLIGRPLYEAFFRNYTHKQWGRDPKELPAAILTRLPFRLAYNMDYFNDPWQGVFREGYTAFFEKLLANPLITTRLGCDFLNEKDKLPADAKIIYTGMPDKLFGCKYGRLDWRSLRFEWETVPCRDFQGTSVMNYPDLETPFTRIHEFKHYHPERKEIYESGRTVICREYPRNYEDGLEPYYPVNDARNNAIFELYKKEAEEAGIILGGRLGAYRYWDMDKAIGDALRAFEEKIRP